MNSIPSQNILQDAAQSSYEKIKATLSGISNDEAIRAVEGFTREAPDFAEAHNDLGVLYYRAGDKLQTLGHYQKAVRLEPRNITFRKNLASFYFVEMGWTDDAIEMYVEILKAFPADCESLIALGIISEAVGRPDEAGIFLRRAVELEPWNDEARQALGRLENRDQTSLETLMDEHPDLHLPASVSEIDQILAGLRQAEPTGENSSEELYRKALKLADDGMIEHAVSDLNRILRTGWNPPLIHNDLGVLYSRIGDNTRAMAHHEQAVALAPENADFGKNLAGFYYSALGRTDDTIALYSGILKKRPTDTEVLGALALISMNLGRAEEARIFLKRIVEIEPHNTDAGLLLNQLANGGENGFFLAAG